MDLRRLGATALAGLSAAAAVLPACTATANVSEVWMSIDEDGARRRGTFFTDSDKIVCVAEIGISREDVTLGFVIRRIMGAPFGTRAFAPENTIVTARESRPGRTGGRPGKATLALMPTRVEAGQLVEDPDAPFTPGSYVCEVTIDGEEKGRVQFNIDYPPCPSVTIPAGQPCAGFYTTNPVTDCPQAGLGGAPEPRCRCEQTVWTCS